MDTDVLGTEICPSDFGSAARDHGRHFSRYLFAGTMAPGKRVLDAACGGGFGSAWMARVATSVTGVDLDDKMIATARRLFTSANLRFLKHDLHEPLAEARSFDLVTSFETMEHVRDPNVCVGNLAAALTDEGTALISIPNGTKELRDGVHEPSHLVQFSAADFEKMTGGHFGRVEMFSQKLHRGVAYYVRKWTGGGRHHAHDYRFVPGLDDYAKTWLAVCREPRR